MKMPVWIIVCGPGRRRGRYPAALVALVVLLLCPRATSAQELEPRSLTNVPIGVNFAVVGYGYSTGDILLDPAVPIEDLDAKLHVFVGAYVRSIDFFGRSGKVDIVVPFAAGDWKGVVSGRDSSTARDGFGDPRVRLSVNFVGAPALRAAEYGGYRQHTIVGASLQVIAPLGQYDPSKLINLGSNRWTFRPQIIEKDVPAELFWSVVIYDTDTRCIIDNREGAAGGKATMGSKTPGLRNNDDGSYHMLLGPDEPPKGWEANHVQTIPGRGWFPYMRAYGARAEFFNDGYKFPTVNKVKDFAEYTK